MSETYFVGVDVGTGSTRAALVDATGKLLKQHVQTIKTWNPQANYYEQSSNDIWQAVCVCVRAVTSEVPKSSILGIGFDATCSLVVLGDEGKPLPVSPTCENSEQNIILWMDHRAEKETELINATKHQLLTYVGGKVSVEMQMPKLLWLKHNYSQTWSKLWRVFDLSDFLTWRSTDSDARSLCSVVCKWNYDAINMTWQPSFLQQIGLNELCAEDFLLIGKDIRLPGMPIGKGLSERAALELNLRPGTAVSTALIDAHAGALGMMGCRAEGNIEGANFETKMAIISGTSTCHMSLSHLPCHTNGVWGPYKNAILPEYFLNEGGQSTTGFLLDYIIKTHSQFKEVQEKIMAEGTNIYTYLNNMLGILAKRQNLQDVCYLTKNLHVWPDFHGNRSPVADPGLKGMISGLSMDANEESLAVLYLAFVQALCYGTRHIIDNLVQHGRKPFNMLLFCGGLAKNPLYVQSHADICGLPAVIPHESEMVLIGAAMLGACASKSYQSLQEAALAMGGTGEFLEPKISTHDYHERKYRVFLHMLQDQQKYKQIMN